MYVLESPLYFYLLAILPILVMVLVFKLWWQKKAQLIFVQPSLFKQLAPHYSIFKIIAKTVLLLLVLALLTVSLVNPKMGTKVEKVKREGVSIVFALDVSKSMLSDDIAPNRLEKAKQIINKTIDALGSDRIGVIIYAGNAYPLLPLTTDHAAAKLFLKNASPNLVSNQGTAINQALLGAKSYFQKNDKSSKFLVVISDGEDHESSTIAMANDLSDEGIKIMTIGVGTEKGGVIPNIINGLIRGVKHDKDGAVVISKRNTGVLKQIASETKGFYVDGNVTEKPVTAITEFIGKAQKSAFQSSQFSEYQSQYQWFLGMAIVLLLLDFFVFEKKTKWVHNINLFNEKENTK